MKKQNETNNQESVIEDLAINEDQAAEVKGGAGADYSAVVFVGGWGASSYQYAFEGTYHNSAYNR